MLCLDMPKKGDSGLVARTFGTCVLIQRKEMVQLTNDHRPGHHGRVIGVWLPGDPLSSAKAASRAFVTVPSGRSFVLTFSAFLRRLAAFSSSSTGTEPSAASGACVLQYY